MMRFKHGIQPEYKILRRKQWTLILINKTQKRP